MCVCHYKKWGVCYTGGVRAHPDQESEKALGPKPCKVNHHDQHAKVSQHVLAEEVSNNPKKEPNLLAEKTVSNIWQSPMQKSMRMCLMKKFPDKFLYL